MLRSCVKSIFDRFFEKISKINGISEIFVIYILPMFLGSSAVEQVAVNHWVGGSSPSRGAIFLFVSEQS